MFRKVQGIIHGFRLKASVMSFTNFSVGVFFSFQETGILNPSLFSIYVMVMTIFTFAVVLNSYCDWELGVDDEKTTSNRMMFDYGLEKKDILRYIIGGTISIFIIYLRAFSHFPLMERLIVFFIICQLIFFSVIYNMPPIRFKKRLFGAELAVVFSYGLLSFCGYFFNSGVITIDSFYYGIPCFVLVTLTITGNLLHDVEDDARGGSYSSAMYLGPVISSYLFDLWILIAFTSLFFISQVKNNMFINLPFILIPYFYFISQRVRNHNLKNIKYYDYAAVSMFNILYLVGINCA
ncbi:hypothetical protein CYY_004775 [Polysphondylium violaceum]|uniref:UbiA prenyltransferase family protein n=1 Tax=Polysphondylium violaceum TaxID=133409 RepID=A0A8J4USR3_9MYCE|nr:hypothetical protein CYY_004775 [Polysphondylium violaceum]